MIEICILAFIEFCAWSMTIFPTIGDELGTRQGDLILLDANYTHKKVWFCNVALLCMASYWSYNGAEISWIPLGAMAVSTALHFWAACELGEFCTSSLGVRFNHHVVTTGPYHFFRHPSYLAQFIFATFMVRFFVGFYGVIAIPFLCFDYYRNVMAEDEMMNAAFNEEYSDYAHKFFL